MGRKVIETDAKKILNQGKMEERVNTERECRRADAAEQKAIASERKASILQKELDAVKQQFRDLMQAQGSKLAEQ